MNYQKSLTAIFLSAIGVFQLACQPLNVAQSSQQPNSNQPAENKKAGNLAENKVLTGETKASLTEKAKNSATPKPKADNFVCPEPNLPCEHKEKQFENWELSFGMPAKLVANREYKSAPFYAVILKKYDEGCDELDENPSVEPERKRIQKTFPSRKVFAEYSCPNMDAVGYDFAGKRSADGETVLYMDYIAVYAGVDEAEGREIFNLLKKDYPQAELKRMTASYSRLEQ